MTYIKNRIDKLREWLEEAPRANTSVPAQNRDERLQKLLAQHVEENLQRGRTDSAIFSGQYAFCYTVFGKTPKQTVAKAIYAMGVGQRLGCGIEGTHIRDDGKAITIVFATITPEQVALLRQWDDKMKKGDTDHED